MINVQDVAKRLVGVTSFWVSPLTPPFFFQVLKAYEERGFDMMLKAFNETGYLEKLTGLDKLYEEGEEALESVDWDEEDEGDMWTLCCCYLPTKLNLDTILCTD